MDGPKNDKEHFELLDKIIKGAEFLENPLITDDQKERGMKKYDRYVELARAYQQTDQYRGTGA